MPLLHLSGHLGVLLLMQVDAHLFSSFSLTSLSSMAFMAAVSSSKLFVPIVMTSITTVLDDSASVSDWNACLSDGKEESLLY